MTSYTQHTNIFWNLIDNHKYRPYPYYEYRGVSQEGCKILSIPVDAVSRYDGL